MRGFYKLPMLRFSGHLLAIVTLTLLTQLGGVAWLIAIAFRRRWTVFVAVLVVSYAELKNCLEQSYGEVLAAATTKPKHHLGLS